MTLTNAAVNSRLVVIMILIVGLISSVSVIISSVALSRPGVPAISISYSGNSQPLAQGAIDQAKKEAQELAAHAATMTTTTKAPVAKRDVRHMTYESSRDASHTVSGVWTVAVGYDDGPHQYRDASGAVAGFSRDVVQAVCLAVGLDCRVVYDDYQNCWTSTPGKHGSGGRGLLGHWYDACVGWVSTSHRQNVFRFSEPYVRPTAAQLYVRTAGQRVGAADKIAFVRGFVEDEFCLAEHGGFPRLSRESVVYVNSPRDAAQLLQDGHVSAVFASESAMTPYLDHLSPSADPAVSCSASGRAVMTRKDGAFLNLWNQGFKRIRQNGVYRRICLEASEHDERGQLNCLEE